MDEEKFAYFIVGAESSGTKLVTKLLIQAGCFGADDHKQPLDDALESGRSIRRYVKDMDKIVVRRSVPHGVDHQYPDLKGIYHALKSSGFTVIFVVTRRSWPTMIESHVDQKQHSEDRESALNTIRDAYDHIHNVIHDLSAGWVEVSFGDLLRNRTATLHWLMSVLFLPYQPGFDEVIDPEVENKRVNEYRGQMA